MKKLMIAVATIAIMTSPVFAKTNSMAKMHKMMAMVEHEITMSKQHTQMLLRILVEMRAIEKQSSSSH